MIHREGNIFFRKWFQGISKRFSENRNLIDQDRFSSNLIKTGEIVGKRQIGRIFLRDTCPEIFFSTKKVSTKRRRRHCRRRHRVATSRAIKCRHRCCRRRRRCRCYPF